MYRLQSKSAKIGEDREKRKRNPDDLRNTSQNPGGDFQGTASDTSQGKAAVQDKATQGTASQGRGGVAAAESSLDLSPRVL